MSSTTSCCQVAATMLCFALAGCGSLGTRPNIKPPEPQARLNETHLSKPISEFGDLLQAYPPRQHYPFAAPVIIDVCTIPNYSGESGLPEDFATVLTTILSDIGEAVAVKSPKTLVERQLNLYKNDPGTGPAADLTICGSITEAEKSSSVEFDVEMDMLFGDSKKGSGRNSVDSGGSEGREQEVWTLTIDLHLVDSMGFVAEGVSNSVDVVKHGRSSSYGVFWRGSGVGVKARSAVAQSKSHALRIAAQQSIIMLLGRHFRVPYWRVIPGGERDESLIKAYRSVLANGQAPQDFRLLLFSHGVDVALEGTRFTESENRAVADLMGKLGLPANMSDLDLAIQLWLNVPYQDQGGEPPLQRLRRMARMARNQPTVPTGSQQTPRDTTWRTIAQLPQGKELILRVGFEYGSAELTTATKEKIGQLVQALKDSGRYEGKDWWIELIGHSDARGERARNQKLSESRAEQVRTYLENKFSLPTSRVVSSGRGSEEPLSEREHAKNRRVDIHLVIGERPGAAQRTAGPVKRVVSNSENLPLFPAEQWPLPRGVVLPGKLAAATFSTVRAAYPTGRYNSNFRYYSINLGERESGLFSEVTFFFGVKPRDLLVSWVGFRCRADARQRILDAMRQRFPQGKEEEHDTAEAVNSWVDSEGYRLTLGQGDLCLKIESAAL